MMRYFPQTVYFRKTWRSYQARVLDRLQDHLVDDRLHVVAPPGSGKTVLGLEIVRRLNRPTLILAPTLIIRDQWIERFVQLFLPEGADKPAWITTDLKKPGFLTVATYQAVHTAYAGERPSADTAGTANRVGGRDELIKKLSAVGIRTLVVDEAHHLRSAWWRSLVEVRDALVDLKVVALTATPPYDVTIAEWERYQEFCGPVDYEIAVP
ncbi:MAG: DEAD/DEAH box helicase family protein, partial [Bacteroidota bacterium]